MSLNTYLTFDGNCREAFTFYKKVFGSDFATLMTFADGPPDMKVQEEDKNKVMHVSLTVGSSTLMGSDTAQGFGGSYCRRHEFLNLHYARNPARGRRTLRQAQRWRRGEDANAGDLLGRLFWYTPFIQLPGNFSGR